MATSGPKSSIPPSIDRSVRTASVAPHVRAMLKRLPQPIRLDAELHEDPTPLPDVARELLKLAAWGVGLTLGDIVFVGRDRPLCLRASLDDRSCELYTSDLQQDLRSVARRIVSSLLDGSDVAQVLESFAFQSSSLATLQRITNHMLAAGNLDRALYVMLLGITSGYGLAFNRAALFVHDEERDVFAGAKAIGPIDDAEAHRIWEAIELEDKTLDEMIEDFVNDRVETRFEQLVRGMELGVGDRDGDEIALALAQDGPVVARDAAVSPLLAPLDATGGFALAAVRANERVRALLFADNRFTGAPVSAEQLQHFAFFVDQTALVWDNLSLRLHVEALARFDALTGVFNRRELDARLEGERSRQARAGGRTSLLVVDVDRFKEINDTRGHEAGDAVLRRLGKVLAENLREHDSVARFGGDEFVVLLPELTHDQLRGAAQRIGCLALSEGISLSIGGATFPDDAKQMSLLLTAADAQLYDAKRKGRGCAIVGGERVDFVLARG